MVVAGHDYDRLLSVGKVPKPGQRFPGKVELDNQIGQESLLLVRLWDRHLVVQIYPIRLGVTSSGAKEFVIGTDGRSSVAFLCRPGRIALPCINNRRCKIIGESRGM